MIYQVRVNSNDNKMYKLVRWSAVDFNSNLTLLLQSTNFEQIKDDFETINKIEIYQDGFLIATYSNLDTYANIAYVGKEYVEGEGFFTEAMSVALTKANIVDQVQRLDEQINPVVDPDTMTVEQLKEYKLKQISEACSQDIYNGTSIELEGDVVQRFEYNVHDQINFDELLVLCMVAPEMEYLPYHQHNGDCQFYSRLDVITIVSTLMLRKTQIITYCNQLNQYVRTLSTKADLMEVRYGMELPEQYAERVSQIIGDTIIQMQAFMDRIKGRTDPIYVDGNDDSETPGDNNDGETPEDSYYGDGPGGDDDGETPEDNTGAGDPEIEDGGEGENETPEEN